MKNKTRLTITLSPDLIKKVDTTIDHQLIRNRSQAIENLISQSLSNKIDTAVILTGGKDKTQHCLKKIGDHYLLSITLDHLKKHQITNIVICARQDDQKIKEIFGNGSSHGVTINYSLENKPLGTAGAIKNAEKFINGDSFVVVHGDVLTSLNITDFINFHNNEQVSATIAVKPRLGEKKYGQVSLQGNRILSFSPSSANLGISIINTGLYIFETKILDLIPKKKISNLENDIFPLLVKNKELSAFIFQGIWHDISEKKDYDEARGNW
jgi:NDP-sugar pyrophosphorylase family protein